MVSTDDHIRAGRKHALAVLDMRAAEQGDEAAMALAGGMAAGIRNYLLGKYGPRATFELFFGLAEDILTPELPMANIESDIAKIVEEMSRRRRSA